EERFAKKQLKIKQLITQKTTDLEYLENDFQAFVQQTDQIRATAEKVYRAHTVLADSQVNAIQQLIQQTLKEYAKAEALLNEHQSIYNLLDRQETIYQETLHDVKQLSRLN
ncbi:hypothetical protein, partial [Okeania sp. SIO1H2]|uniref:hypothetical protein n=1 Tax=Okeania sp. SIO1H2 TaxID=2607775 RepID=UPI00141D678E